MKTCNVNVALKEQFDIWEFGFALLPTVNTKHPQVAGQHSLAKRLETSLKQAKLTSCWQTMDFNLWYSTLKTQKTHPNDLKQPQKKKNICYNMAFNAS